MEDLEQKDWNLFLKNTSDPDNIYESDKNPMSPLLFYQLSMVNGFNNLNGHTYKEYIELWTKRIEKLAL
jgi:hypothetical protein